MPVTIHESAAPGGHGILINWLMAGETDLDTAETGFARHYVRQSGEMTAAAAYHDWHRL